MAYADYKQLMDMTEDLLSSLVLALKGDYKFQYHAHGPDNDPITVDFTPPWPRFSIVEELSAPACMHACLRTCGQAMVYAPLYAILHEGTRACMRVYALACTRERMSGLAIINARAMVLACAFVRA